MSLSRFSLILPLSRSLSPHLVIGCRDCLRQARFKKPVFLTPDVAITRVSVCPVNVPIGGVLCRRGRCRGVLVESADAASEALVVEEHPGAKLHAVHGATVPEENRVRLLSVGLRAR
jgi:hypothetical protein